MLRPCLAPLLVVLVAAAPVAADVLIKDRTTDSPLVLDRDTDYTLSQVTVQNVRDTAALTLAGRINSVAISRSRFGLARTSNGGPADALAASGALVGTFLAADCHFFDSEHQLVSMTEGAFGTVTFLRCTFRTSEAFRREVQQRTPWREFTPVAEFANIERLELLDNELGNTIILIHPTVRQVVLRGDVSRIRLQDARTQVVVLQPGQMPGDIPTPGDAPPATVAHDPQPSPPPVRVAADLRRRA